MAKKPKPAAKRTHAKPATKRPAGPKMVAIKHRKMTFFQAR